jgi:hypothetical protein
MRVRAAKGFVPTSRVQGVQGVQDPRPPVTRVTKSQALRQASGTRPSVLQPAGAWLALQRWLEVILVIKRLRDPPSRGGRRAYSTYICAEQTPFRFGLSFVLFKGCAYIGFSLCPLKITQAQYSSKKYSWTADTLHSLKTNFALAQPSTKDPKNDNGKPNTLPTFTTPPPNPNASPPPLKVHRRQRTHAPRTPTTNTNLQLTLLPHPIRDGRPRSRSTLITIANLSPDPNRLSQPQSQKLRF